MRETVGLTQDYVKESFVVAVQAAFELGDLAKVDELLAIVEGLPRGRYPQFLQAQSARFRARLAAGRSDAAEAERLFKGSTGLFRELAFPFYMAVTQLEFAESLLALDRPDEAEPQLAEAREIFERLEAVPWLERADNARTATGVPA